MHTRFRNMVALDPHFAKKKTLYQSIVETKRLNECVRTSLQDACPPILHAVSLKPEMEKDPAMFNAIVDVLLQLYQEAIQLATSSA